MNHRVKREEDNYHNDRVVMLHDDDRMVTMDDDTNGRMVTNDDSHGDGRMVTMEAEEGKRSVNALPRERSISPYSLAMDRWTNFKAMETKLLGYAKVKLEKYDSSPEEHPQYSEEWKDFWQNRYNQVKESGADPDTHDYLAEWIPFWSNKSRDLMEAEVEKRQGELLRKS